MEGPNGSRVVEKKRVAEAERAAGNKIVAASIMSIKTENYAAHFAGSIIVSSSYPQLAL